ncbi:hypothetical protein PAXINDRAFT_11040, partial [Paxillus involutus ATCC 200175]
MADHDTLKEQPQQSPGPSPINWQDWNEADNSEDMYLDDENNATSDQQHDSESVNEPELDDDRDKQASSLHFVNETPGSFNRKRKGPASSNITQADSASDRGLPAGPALKKVKACGVTITEDMVDRMLTGKSKKPVEDLGADDVDEEPRNFMVYVQVWSPSAPEKKPGKGGKASTTIFVSKGPFKFDTLQSFARFQIQVAPQSAPRKKIATIAGYEALIDAIKAKQATENIVVWLYTPKPTKEEDDWDTGGADYVEHPFDFEKETSNGESTSAKGLIAEMSAKCGEAEVLLTKEYPAGKIAIFPDKRVWQNKTTGSYFEITPLRIKIWANAIAAKMANVFAPPTSTHFAEDKKLKVPAAVPDPGPGVTLGHPQAPGGGNGPGPYPPSHFMGFPPPQHFPPYYPAPYPPYYGCWVSLSKS